MGGRGGREKSTEVPQQKILLNKVLPNVAIQGHHSLEADSIFTILRLYYCNYGHIRILFILYVCMFTLASRSSEWKEANQRRNKKDVWSIRSSAAVEVVIVVI